MPGRVLALPEVHTVDGCDGCNIQNETVRTSGRAYRVVLSGHELRFWSGLEICSWSGLAQAEHCGHTWLHSYIRLELSFPGQSTPFLFLSSFIFSSKCDHALEKSVCTHQR